MEQSRFDKQLDFLIQIDRMKNIERQTLISDGSRRETDAEHSWHIAVMAFLLKEYAVEPIDVDRVVRMLLVHDLVEVYAGDTFCYDVQGNLDKREREEEAADRLFSMLPDDQRDEIRALFEEFDRMDTPDSRYAASLDRLQPIINNHLTNGHTWRKGHVNSKQVFERMTPIKEATPSLWPLVEKIVAHGIEIGALVDGKENA